MIVLIADGVQNGIAGQYNSITGALVVAGTLIGWNFCLDAAAYRVPALRSVLYPPPLVLAKDGQYLRKNMRGEMVTREELDALLREQGVESVSDVKKACLESDGQFSLIKHTKEGEPTGEPAKRREGAAT